MDYEELADDARFTSEYQALYAKCKKTIERVFADAKEKHDMRYTLYRDLAQVSKWVSLRFAAMNFKNLHNIFGLFAPYQTGRFATGWTAPYGSP